MMIRCPKCGLAKDEAEYNRNKNNRNGRDTYCRECCRALGRANYEKRRLKMEEKRGQRKTDNREKTTTIRCSGCGVAKNKTEFYVRPRNKTGYETKCKQCLSEQGREYRRENVAARLAYYQRTRKARIEHMREYRKKNMPAIMAKWHEYEQKYPERVQAGDAVHEAIKRKEILPARKCKCVDCGKKAMDLHHESYAQDQWLVVVPLCRSCHKNRHMSSKV